MKKCYKCKVEKSLEDFHRLKKSKDGRTNKCKSCQAEYQRAWYQKNAERERENSRVWQQENADYVRVQRRLRVYNLSEEQYLQMLSDQDGACAICLTPFIDVTPHVDHDHGCCSGNSSCGSCVRGLLCSHCNTAIGMFADDVDRVMAAASYLLTKQHTTGKEQKV